MTTARAPMRVEETHQDGGDAHVVTTGARFRFLADGRIEADQRFPAPRACFVATFGSANGAGAPTPWRVESTDAERAVLRRDSVAAEVRDDSTVTLTSPTPAELTAAPLFPLRHHSRRAGRMIALDDVGGYAGFTAWDFAPRRDGRIRMRPPAPPGHVDWSFDDTAPFRLAVLPPRPPHTEHLGWNIAHEGTPSQPLPTDDQIADAARTCQVLALHAYIWRAAPWRLRLRPGRYFLRSNSWRSARHEPADPDALAHTLETARRHGMKVVLYVSPRYTTAPNVLGEIARILDVHRPDGLYLDGTTAVRGGAGLARMEAVVRGTRALLGPERLLYLHPGDEPYGAPLLPCPFIDAHADFVLRGSEGRGGAAFEPFLRHAVAGWNVSGAVGVWCHYGSDGRVHLRERPPLPDDVETAARNHARVWRRSRWGADALRAFDARYGPAFKAVHRGELRTLGESVP